MQGWSTTVTNIHAPNADGATASWGRAISSESYWITMTLTEGRSPSGSQVILFAPLAALEQLVAQIEVAVAAAREDQLAAVG